MARKLTEEERKFIAEQFQKHDKVGQQIIELFKEKFEWIPSASVINKYQKYPIDEEQEKINDGEQDEDLSIETKDTRKLKGVFEITDGDIPDDVFNQIAELRGKGKYETFEFLRKCYEKGLTKINLKTGDISK